MIVVSKKYFSPALALYLLTFGRVPSKKGILREFYFCCNYEFVLYMDATDCIVIHLLVHDQLGREYK